MDTQTDTGGWRSLTRLLLLAGVCLLVAWAEPTAKDIRSEAADLVIQQAFDEARNELYSLPQTDYLTDRKILQTFQSSMKSYETGYAEDLDVLTRYLKALSYQHYRSYGDQAVYDLENEWKYLKDIPEDYSWHEAEAILYFRNQVGEQISRLEAAREEAPACPVKGCPNRCLVDLTAGGKIERHAFCRNHKCAKYHCDRQRVTQLYCEEHSPKKKSASGTKKYSSGSGTKKYSSGSGTKKYSSGSGTKSYSSGTGSRSGKKGSSSSADPYDTDCFDDPDDFADEWAEEFGDGDFDEGWDDAWDYWQENHE